MKAHTYIRILASFFFGFSLSAHSFAAPMLRSTQALSGPLIQNPGSGHYYQLVENLGGINWYEARDAAASTTFKGKQGYLAVVTSTQEDEFLTNNFPKIFPYHVWLGATDEEVEGDWQWITGESWGYTNWNTGPGEPNGGTFENCLEYSNNSVSWSDASCDRKINYYLVEYDTPVTVDIDIKPGNKRNVINPRAQGGIWVAILSDTDPVSPFDPSSQVDIGTVEFGPDGASATRYKVKDINKDRLGDLLLRFSIPATGIACSNIRATLTGQTYDALNFAGTDSIRTVGCPKDEMPEQAMQNPDNGHWYRRYDASMTWHESRAFCESEGGYLATITSPAENDFVFVNLAAAAPNDEVWLGGTDQGQEGIWRWITGEPWEYSNWASVGNEPNNSGGFEHYLTISSLLGPDDREGSWNDSATGNDGRCDSSINCGIPTSMICEWNSKKQKTHHDKWVHKMHQKRHGDDDRFEEHDDDDDDDDDRKKDKDYKKDKD